MTVISDLEEFEYSHSSELAYSSELPPVINAVAIGWLGNRLPRSGRLGRTLKDALRHLSEHHYTDDSQLGFHTCAICNRYDDRGEFVFLFEDKCYVMPQMLIHYMDAHGYRPPESFLAELATFWGSPASKPCREGRCKGPYKRPYREEGGGLRSAEPDSEGGFIEQMERYAGELRSQGVSEDEIKSVLLKKAAELRERNMGSAGNAPVIDLTGERQEGSSKDDFNSNEKTAGRVKSKGKGEKRPILCTFDYGADRHWLLIDAFSASEIEQRYPMLQAYELRPDWLDADDEAEIRRRCEADSMHWDIDSKPSGLLKDAAEAYRREETSAIGLFMNLLTILIVLGILAVIGYGVWYLLW